MLGVAGEVLETGEDLTVVGPPFIDVVEISNVLFSDFWVQGIRPLTSFSLLDLFSASGKHSVCSASSMPISASSYMCLSLSCSVPRFLSSSDIMTVKRLEV